MVDIDRKYESLFDMWKHSCKEFSTSVAFSDTESKLCITYKQAFNELCFLIQKFSEYGINRFDKICLFCINFPRWLIIEQAIITLGAVCVSKTSEIGINELDYVFTNSDSVGLITDNPQIINSFSQNNKLDNLKFILYTGKKENSSINTNQAVIYLDDILNELTYDTELKTDWREQADDIAYINYTSGTSSNPKGAMLPNIGMSYVVEQLQKFNNIQKDKTFIVTFPLSSAGGKSFVLLCFSRGCKIVFTEYKKFYNAIDSFKPDYLHCAPKIIQTVHNKLIGEVKNKGFIFEILYNFAFSISTLLLKAERKFNCASLIKLIKILLDKSIFKQIRNKLFKDSIVIFVGSAHLAKPLEDYFDIMSIPLIQHYGLTETTGLAVSNTLESQRKHYYTVGKAFDGTIIEIVNPETHQKVEDEEIGLITLGGPEIMKGYYKNPEATEKALLKNGFLNTGDLGFIINTNEGDYLTVLSRYDDVIVLSNGYNVYAPLLENEAKDSEYINQIVICGHGKPYLTAIIVLNNNQYELWCNKNNVKIKDPNQNSLFKDFLTEHLNEKIKRKNEFRYYEKLKKIYFAKEEFTAENGLLTGTLKIKTKAVLNLYAKEIEKLYEGEI